MELQYHEIITRDALGEFFAEAALREIIAANFRQDSPANLIGKPYLHFDNDKIAESLAYIDGQLARLVGAAGDDAEIRRVQWDAFGRLCHTAQDFYAHSNYVDLWLAENGGTENVAPAEIDGVDEKFLAHPALRTGSFHLLRDIVYYIPGIRTLARRIHIPQFSHEMMHLDDPTRGEKFAFAMAAAVQRTRFEYRRTVDALSARGGSAAVARFLGKQ